MLRSEREKPTKGISYLLLATGIVALVGTVGIVAADVVGILLVEAHNPISETISKLAVGRYAWVQDLGIISFAVGVAATAVGLYVWRSGGWAWTTGLLLLFLLAVDLIPIAVYNQYAGTGHEGARIHLYLVYALYGLFALASLLLSFGLQRAGYAWRRFSLSAFAAWTVLAPFLFVVPTAWNGAYERLVGLIMLAWFGSVAWLLIQMGTHRADARR